MLGILSSPDSAAYVCCFFAQKINDRRQCGGEETERKIPKNSTMMHTDGPLLQIADATPESNLPRERKSPKSETASFFTKRKSARFCKTENPPPPFFPNRCCYLSPITQGPLYLLYYNASVSLYGPGGGGLFGAAGAATAAAVQKKRYPGTASLSLS